MADDASPPAPPRSRLAHTLAWAAFVACGACVAIVFFTILHARAPVPESMRDDVGAGIRGIGLLLELATLVLTAGVALALALLARKRAPGDPFIELAFGAGIVALATAILLGPVLLYTLG